MSSNSLAKALMNAEVSVGQCEKHGEYKSCHIVYGTTDSWSGCPTCAEEKVASDRMAEFEANQREAARARMERMIGYACLPPRFADKTFDTYRAESEQQRNYLAKCQAYAADFPDHLKTGEGLLMLGNPGTGKTHLAVATLNDVITRHQTQGLYTTAARMFRRIKDTYGSREETETQAIDAYTKPALLVLDEIGVSFGSDAELNYLFDVMNERYEQCLPTIVVSNVQPGELGQWMGDRVVDRLRESSKMMVFGWESARKSLGRNE
ncbi:ATP-binding protein [Phytohalomonas tamaricis]|uniref:ATP-binding protein n=1 Tax=Phytohalomonas tamaricis TaxID=2081032 RepID=UPI001319FF68|nr:ATP-binding protein [Phytohalomonas tamaricis]